MSNHTSTTVAAILCEGKCEGILCTTLATYMEGTDAHMSLTRMENFRRLNITDRNAYTESIAPEFAPL